MRHAGRQDRSADRLHPTHHLSTDRLTQALRTGRFKDALQLLRSRSGGQLQASQEALLSELQLRVGEVKQAGQSARLLLHRPGVDVSAQAQCHLVLGTICRDTGRLDEARAHYDKAITLAGLQNDLRQLCLAQMRLVTLQVFGSEGPEVDGVLNALRRNVQKSGDPLLTIALHICRAELETRNGMTDLAQAQLTSARRLLRYNPNAYLEGNAAIAALCLALVRSEWNEAIEHGQLALKCARLSGNVRTALAANLNLGQVLLNQGRPEDAESYLSEALSLCPTGGDAEIGLLDALAQAALARGDVDRCELHLSQIDRILAMHHLPSAYNRYWGLKTRLSMLGRLGRWHEAFQLVTQVGATVPDPPDSSLHVQLKLAKAEIHLAIGQLEDAQDTLAELTAKPDSMALEQHGQLERLLALHAARQFPSDAPTHFERATRILLGTQNQISYIKVLEEYSAFLDTWSSNEALDRNCRASAVPMQSKSLVERLAALHRFAHDPHLLGVEAFWLFVESDEAVNVALATGEPGQQRIVLSLPAYSEWFERTLASPKVAIALDSKSKWVLHLQARARRRLSSTSCALVTLVRSCAETRAPVPNKSFKAETVVTTPERVGVFVSDAMNAIVANVAKVASTPLPILITGETGTGKEILARLIHQQSPYATMPFVAFNCATVPRELLDSQLFGHRRGAFTGAHQDFPGIIRTAEGGTLFLDEIGDLGRESQPKLLRFLESGEIYPLGELAPVTANVRIIAATNAELDTLVRDGQFRQDLLYRLNAVRYRLPPLRERREEIPALVEHFLAIYSREFQKGHVRIADEALDYLLFYAWPGNVRQLANEIRRAVALADPDEILSPDRLSPEIAPGWQARETGPARPASAGLLLKLDQPLGAAVAQLERAMLDHALRATGGRLDAAARRLGLSRKGLYLKRQRLAAARDAASR